MTLCGFCVVAALSNQTSGRRSLVPAGGGSRAGWSPHRRGPTTASAVVARVESGSSPEWEPGRPADTRRAAGLPRERKTPARRRNRNRPALWASEEWERSEPAACRVRQPQARARRAIPEKPAEPRRSPPVPDNAAESPAGRTVRATRSHRWQRLDAGENLFLLDVREEYEYEISNIGGHLIPFGRIADACQ